MTASTPEVQQALALVQQWLPTTRGCIHLEMLIAHEPLGGKAGEVPIHQIQARADGERLVFTFDTHELSVLRPRGARLTRSGYQPFADVLEIADAAEILDGFYAASRPQTPEHWCTSLTRFTGEQVLEDVQIPVGGALRWSRTFDRGGTPALEIVPLWNREQLLAQYFALNEFVLARDTRSTYHGPRPHASGT